jgi:hypothetical protein
MKNLNGWGIFSGNKRLTNVEMDEEGKIEENGDIILSFGKYKDTPLKNVPEGYLRWMYENIQENKYNKSVKWENPIKAFFFQEIK